MISGSHPSSGARYRLPHVNFAMSRPVDRNAMSVFGRATTAEVIASELHGIDMISSLEVAGENSDSMTIIGRDASTTTINLKHYRVPGDEFSLLYVGMMNFVRMHDLGGHAERALRDFEMAVGIVFLPACIVVDDWRFDIPFAIARRIGGTIFNGTVLVDAEGTCLLDAST